MDKAIHAPTEARVPSERPATADESQRLHVIEVLKAAALREQNSRVPPADEGGDPYNTASRRLPRNTPWAHLTRKD